MPIEQSVTEVLDEAIQALTALDLSRLEQLEKDVAALAQSAIAGQTESKDAIFEKKRLLAMILQNCRSNLDALNRLHGRNTRGSWAH